MSSTFRVLGVFVLLQLFCIGMAAAETEHRVALIIGNGAYPGTPLDNAANDARAMATALGKLGFEVTALENSSKKPMERAIIAFGEKLKQPNTVGLFYYAGHGMQVKGQNYIIPVDAAIDHEADVRIETVPVDLVTDQMGDAGNRLNIIILDACRDNPFERKLRGAGGHGLAAMDAARGTLIAYATAPGATAADGTDGHGLYTDELLRALKEPGLKVEEVFKRVRVAVAQRSRGVQTPWESSSLTGEFVFNPVPRVAMAAPPAAAAIGGTPPVAAPDRAIRDLDATFVTLRTAKVRAEPSAMSKDLDTLPPDSVVKVTGRVGPDWLRVAWGDGQAYISAPQMQEVDEGEVEKWASVTGTKSPTDVEAFLRAYPNGFYAGSAKALLERLRSKPQQVAMAPPARSRAESLAAPGQTFRACANCPEMVSLPGGTFMMGSNGDPSERPVHQVTVAPFAIGRFPVTNGEWRLCFKAHGCTWAAVGDDDEPVRNVSWEDAQQYIAWLAKATDRNYRLPTEAEFEFAARGGNDGSYWSGDKLKLGVADCKGCGEPYDPKAPQKVGTFKPNGYGLFDMAGSVEEWVADCWHHNYVGAPSDGSAWVEPKCDTRVLRGGLWKSEMTAIRPTNRAQYDAVVRYVTHGFRVARSP
jgi:formylglycine-generating enzyme required for sulfatase activity